MHKMRRLKTRDFKVEKYVQFFHTWGQWVKLREGSFGPSHVSAIRDGRPGTKEGGWKAVRRARDLPAMQKAPQPLGKGRVGWPEEGLRPLPRRMSCIH